MANPHILNIISSTLQTDVPFLSRTNMSKTKEVTPDGGGSEKHYVLKTSSSLTPLTGRVGIYPNLSKGTVKYVFQLKTWAAELNADESAYLWQGAVVGTLTIELPVPAGIIDDEDFMVFIGNLYSMTYESVTSDVPDLGVATNLKYGVPSIMNNGS